MSDPAGPLEKIYHLLLRAYPSEYVETFGDEMQGPFVEGLKEARSQGVPGLFIYDHEHHTLVLFPDGYRMEMARQENMLSYLDEYDIVMVDKPDADYPRLSLNGHTPRDYPHLSFAYLPQTSKLAVASAHGVSLVSLPVGEMGTFWTLTGDGFSPWLTAAPDGSALVPSKDFGGLSYIPLRPDR